MPKTIKHFIAQMNFYSKNIRERFLQNQLFILKILFVHQSLFQLQIFAKNSITLKERVFSKFIKYVNYDTGFPQNFQDILCR